MHIIGTAGHVDHGKSSLVEALTGTNPDRLKEERQREMTLDLGFAHLQLEDGIEAGIVDVPGHERFLHNMLAGAAGMELVLLVVDANEGVMPQTREHLAILSFLNVRAVIVAVTKIDLVDPRDVEQALQRVAAGLHSTIAESAPMVAVSVRTGAGVEELKAALACELRNRPQRGGGAPVYLPIDRVFTLPGLGTVVTGTLMQGSIGVGDRVQIEPGDVSAAVRSIGVFESQRERVLAGSRVALSLPGVDRASVKRGQAVVGSELHARKSFSVRFRALDDALPLLRRRTPVRAYLGSAEVFGTLIASEAFAAGEEVHATLALREPVVAFAGLRFVLRRPSPMTLLGGGFVEGVEATVVEDAADADEAAVGAVLRAAAFGALEAPWIASAANLREEVVCTALERLVERGEAIEIARPQAYVDGAAASGVFERAIGFLEATHEAEPWAMGMTSLALSRALAVDERLLVRVLAHFAETVRLLSRDGYYSALEHRPALTAEQLAFFDETVPIDRGQPLLPVPFAGVASAVKRSRIPGISRAFDTMLAQGMLVKVADDCYRGEQIEEIRSRVVRFFQSHPQMTAAEFRDLLGTSRKYAVPLLEWLDAHNITIRNADHRTLRKPPNPSP